MGNNPFKALYNFVGSYAKWVGENEREWSAYKRYGPNWQTIIQEQNTQAAERMLSLQAKKREMELTEASDFARTGMRSSDKTAPYTSTFKDGKEFRQYDFDPSEPHAPGKTRAEVLAETGVAGEAEKGRFERLLKTREFGREERESGARVASTEALQRYREGEIAAQPAEIEGERLRQIKTRQDIAKGAEDVSSRRRREAVARVMLSSGELKSDAEAEAFIMRGYVPPREPKTTAAERGFERTLRRDRVLEYANEIAGAVEGAEGQEFAAYGKIEDVPPDIRSRAEAAVTVQIASERERGHKPAGKSPGLSKAVARPSDLGRTVVQDQAFLKQMRAKRARGEEPT